MTIPLVIGKEREIIGPFLALVHPEISLASNLVIHNIALTNIVDITKI